MAFDVANDRQFRPHVILGRVRRLSLSRPRKHPIEHDLALPLAESGKDLAGKIADIVASGHFDLLDKLKKKLPGELGEMPGLAPKHIHTIFRKHERELFH